MRQERHAGYEVKALSNLIRRKVWELSGQPECDAFTEMQGMLLGFLSIIGIRKSFRRIWRRRFISAALPRLGC